MLSLFAEDETTGGDALAVAGSGLSLEDLQAGPPSAVRRFKDRSGFEVLEYEDGSLYSPENMAFGYLYEGRFFPFGTQLLTFEGAIHPVKLAALELIITGGLSSGRSFGSVARGLADDVAVQRPPAARTTQGAPNARSTPAAPSGKTVLGSHPKYLELADELGAKRFNIPPEVWKRMTPAERWAANQKFLDRMIARGDEIILSNNGHEAIRSSTFFKEIEYLKSKGFRLSDDGLRMLPPSQ